MFAVQCPFCEQRNPAGSRYCNDCGSPLHLKPCPECGAVEDVLARTCYKCGAVYPEQIELAAAPRRAPPQPPGPIFGSDDGLAEAVSRFLDGSEGDVRLPGIATSLPFPAARSPDSGQYTAPPAGVSAADRSTVPETVADAGQPRFADGVAEERELSPLASREPAPELPQATDEAGHASAPAWRLALAPYLASSVPPAASAAPRVFHPADSPWFGPQAPGTYGSAYRVALPGTQVPPDHASDASTVQLLPATDDELAPAAADPAAGGGPDPDAAAHAAAIPLLAGFPVPGAFPVPRVFPPADSPWSAWPPGETYGTRYYAQPDPGLDEARAAVPEPVPSDPAGEAAGLEVSADGGDHAVSLLHEGAPEPPGADAAVPAADRARSGAILPAPPAETAEETEILGSAAAVEASAFVEPTEPHPGDGFPDARAPGNEAAPVPETAASVPVPATDLDADPATAYREVLTDQAAALPAPPPAEEPIVPADATGGAAALKDAANRPPPSDDRKDPTPRIAPAGLSDDARRRRVSWGMLAIAATALPGYVVLAQRSDPRQPVAPVRASVQATPARAMAPSQPSPEPPAAAAPAAVVQTAAAPPVEMPVIAELIEEPPIEAPAVVDLPERRPTTARPLRKAAPAEPIDTAPPIPVVAAAASRRAPPLERWEFVDPDAQSQRESARLSPGERVAIPVTIAETVRPVEARVPETASAAPRVPRPMAAPAPMLPAREPAARIPALQRPERPERFERFERPEKADRPEHVERPLAVARLEKVERPENAERPERVERPEKAERPERVERPEKIERPERVERPEKIERPERVERPEKIERPERVERPEKIERPERVERPEKIERVEKVERPEKIEKGRG